MLIRRILRAIGLDPNLYEEVETDRQATPQAMLVVILAGIVTGIGTATIGSWQGLLIGIAIGLLGWAVWAWLNYQLGAKLFREPQTVADWGQLARTMGFAYSPRLLWILGVIPGLLWHDILALVILVWGWAAMVIAVRQALDYKSTLRAVAVTFLGFLVNVGLFWAINRFVIARFF